MLHWYGHILWLGRENKVKQTMKMEVRGAKGRPRIRWMDNIRHDMNTCEDGGGIRQEKTEEDGTEPRLKIQLTSV